MAFINEKLIVERVVEGDDKAFASLYIYYKPVLYRLIIRILKSDDLAKDCCQEIFLKIWEDREKLIHIQSFQHYLLVIGKNHSLNTLKRVCSEEKTLAKLKAGYNDVSREFEDGLQFEEYNEFISGILEAISPQSKRVFELCRQQELSYDEAAIKLGISKNVIKKHMVKSMRVLRLALERDLGIAFTTLVLIVNPSW